jgi:hypothetical protein
MIFNIINSKAFNFGCYNKKLVKIDTNQNSICSLTK